MQLVLANVDATAAATGEVVVYDQDGQQISNLFDSGPRFGISVQGSRVLRSTGTGPIRRGWIEVQSESGSVWGLLTYRHGETGIEVGVAPVNLGDHFALFVEETSEIGTGLAIFKPEVAPEIELQIRDEGGNDPIGEGLTIGSFQQQALTLPEWFQEVDTTFLRDFRGLLFLRAPDADLFAPLGLRFGKEKGSLSAVPVIPVRDESEGSSPNPFPPVPPERDDLLYFPDYVQGDEWSVQLVLVNVGATTAEVGVAVYDQAGRPVRDLFDSGSTFEIPSRGSRVLKSPQRRAIRRGWIEVETGKASVGGIVDIPTRRDGDRGGSRPGRVGRSFRAVRGGNERDRHRPGDLQAGRLPGDRIGDPRRRGERPDRSHPPPREFPATGSNPSGMVPGARHDVPPGLSRVAVPSGAGRGSLRSARAAVREGEGVPLGRAGDPDPAPRRRRPHAHGGSRGADGSLRSHRRPELDPQRELAERPSSSRNGLGVRVDGQGACEPACRSARTTWRDRCRRNWATSTT